MLLLALAFERSKAIVHMLRGTCEYELNNVSHLYEECSVEFESGVIDHFHPNQPEEFAVAGINGSGLECITDESCTFESPANGFDAMCTFKTFRIPIALKNNLQIPLRLDDIGNYSVIVQSGDCDLSLRVFNMHYNRASYSLPFLIQFMGFVLILWICAAYSGLRAMAFFFQNEELISDLPLSTLTKEINFEQILIFLVADLGSNTKNFKKLHVFMELLGILIQVPAMVLTVLALFRIHGFRGDKVHAVLFAFKLCRRLLPVLLFIFSYMRGGIFQHFAYLELFLLQAYVYFDKYYRLGQGHKLYSRFLILDICRSEATLMYFYGFDNYLGFRGHVIYAVCAYSSCILVLWSFSAAHQRKCNGINGVVATDCPIVLESCNYSEYIDISGLAVAVSSGSRDCQNIWHVHRVASGIKKYCPEQLSDLRLNEFDTRCYVLVGRDFFGQQCPICLDEMEFDLKQFAVCTAARDVVIEIDRMKNELSYALEGERLTELKCGHIFHEECIFKWIKECSTCPRCRKELL